MKRILASTTVGVLAVALASTAFAQLKPEEQIETRQAGFTFMAWNMGRIKANLQGDYNPEQVTAAANAIAGIAQSGMGALFGPGTDQDIDEVETHVKPELFQNMEEAGKLMRDLASTSEKLAKAAAGGDKAAVQTAFGDVGKSCKSCHDKFRAKD